MPGPVLCERSGGVARITLNRPEKLNALTAELHQALREALDAVERDSDCRVLVITGAGRAFCAGQDLNERRPEPGRPPIDLGEQLDRDLNPLVLRLRALPILVIAAVNGLAAGAGASLALAADLVVAARSARFIFAFTRLGLGPDGGSSWLLPRLVGPARAFGLTLLAEPLDATTAQDWGLIWRCVEDAALAGTVDAIVQHIRLQPREALAETKRALHAAWDTGFEAQLGRERDAQRRLGFGAEYREGVAAFLEKRRPAFGPPVVQSSKPGDPA
jgi:2-(1,2-epoxy-1,2-dihydrophenyl)acetyl-CoA isomerase